MGSYLPANLLTLKLASCLLRLLRQGDIVEIQAGRLLIEPKSGLPVPNGWLKENETLLVQDIAKLAGQNYLRYEGFTRGKYGKNKTAGITLQLRNIEDGRDSYLIFNALIKRQRKSKKGNSGDLLPGSQFTVTRNMKFYKFWGSTGLDMPDRLARFWAYMGNLKALHFTGEYEPYDIKQEKIQKDTFKPLNVSYETLLNSIRFIHAADTTKAQAIHSTDTRFIHKQSDVGQFSQGIQRFSATGENNHGRRLKGKSVNSNSVTPLNNLTKQTVEEWEEDYKNGLNSPSFP